MTQSNDPPKGGGRRPDDARILPADIQEHLGRKLRATLAVDAEKPAYLGDDAVPPRFAGIIRKLAATERSGRATGLPGDAAPVVPDAGRTGLDAVSRALDLGSGPDQPPWQDGQKKVERPD